MTDSFKYGLGALAAIVLLFLYNQNSQTSYEASTEVVFNDSVENIKRIKFTDKAESLELVKQDSI